MDGDQAVTTLDDEFDRLLAAGGAAIASGDLEPAREALEDALAIRSRDPQVLGLLGQVFYRLARFDDAAIAWQRLVDDNPVEPGARVNLGLAFLKARQYQAAVQQLRIAIDLNPDHRKAAGYLGLAWLELGDPAQARDWFERAGSEQMVARCDELLAAPDAPVPPVEEPEGELVAAPGSETEPDQAPESGPESEPEPEQAPESGPASVAEAVRESEWETAQALEPAQEPGADDAPEPRWETEQSPEPALEPAPEPAPESELALGAEHESEPTAEPTAEAPPEADPAALEASVADLPPEAQGMVSPPAAPSHPEPAGLPTLAGFAAARAVHGPAGQAFVADGATLTVNVHGELLCRLAGLAAWRGELAFAGEVKRFRGRATDKPFGDPPDQMHRLVGDGLVVLRAAGRRFTVVELGGETGYFREAVVFGFQEQVAFENGRLPSPAGGLDLVHLRGRGRLVLVTRGELVAMEVTEASPVHVPLASLVGWTGALTPRLAPLFAGGSEGEAVEISGAGRVLVDPGPSSRPGDGP